MNVFEQILFSYSERTIPILDVTIPISSYTPLDLSVDNVELQKWDIANPTICQSYINLILEENSGQVAYGGYLEHRNLYSEKPNFNAHNEEPRNIHLGVDYWAKAGTEVICPLDGRVHSFKNNTTVGDYGPTIIMEHTLGEFSFYTLYGHLSLESLENLKIGTLFNSGSTLGTLGTPEINVNYAPHLHFQIIRDIQGNTGDYPGVCAKRHLEFYRNNCPDPNLLLKIK